MKYFSILLCLVLFGCMDNGVKVANDAQSGTAGKISFVLSKTSIPQEIASLTFTLTNLSTSETVSKTLVVSADTVMQVEFEQLAVGAWHVKVVAKDSTSGTKYAGESDANVIEGQTTQLALSLTTLTTGVGTLVITVNWPGKAPFADYTANPVLRKKGLWFDTRGIGYPSVLYDGEKYKMWFMNYGLLNGSPYGTISLAESIDGTTWTRVADTVLTPSTGKWDAATVVPGTVIKENGVYTMYYYGGTASGVYNSGMATSQDGIHWTKNPTPIFSTGGNSAVVGAVKANGQYYMYYHTAPTTSINLATSTDGVNWQKYAGNPVLIGNLSWENYHIAYGSVVYENNTFTMLYVRDATSQSFGVATSTDGINWVKDTRNPVFSISTTANGWAPYSIGYPFLVRVGNDLRIYYTGFAYDGTESIGYAVKQ